MDEQEKTGKRPPEVSDKKRPPKGRVISSDYRDMFPKQQQNEQTTQSKPAGKSHRTAPGEAVKAVVKAAQENVHEGFDLLEEQTADTGETPEKESVDTVEAETISKGTSAFRARGKRKKLGLATGVVVLLLALTGVGFLAATIGTQIYQAATDDSRERAYDEYLKPLVMQDPDAYDTPAEADEQMVLSASLWKALEDNSASYTDYDDMGRTIVPLADVSDACHGLFGPEVELQLNGLDEDNFFTFDDTDNQFHVTPYSTQSSFIPYTESIRVQADGEKVLTVGYVAPSDQWRSDNANAPEEPSPIKYMEYVIAETEDGQEYVAQIRESDTSERAVSAQS